MGIFDSTKRVLSRAAIDVLGRDAVWQAVPSALRANAHVRVRREESLRRQYEALCAVLFADLVVKDGPFAGLRYVEGKACGSALYPKLLGTYESELHPFFRNVEASNYQLVVDIGCAEGYYLVGLGRLLPSVPLIGIDIDPAALDLVKKMAALNDIKKERLTLRRRFSVEDLAPFLPARSLVICDCEGFEEAIFTSSNINIWRESDLLIECHDFLIPGITENLTGHLSYTHTCKVIETAEPEVKVGQATNDLFCSARPEHQLSLVSECRPRKMSWILASPFPI
jgi:SAM-dependent methyltransferase